MPTSPQRARQPQAQPPQIIDTLLLGTVSFNSAPAGRCTECHATTASRRAARVTYLPPRPNRQELEQIARGEDAQAGDRYFQRLARRQRRGDFGDERRMALCATCALAWLITCIENGPGLMSIPGASASNAEAVYNVRALVAAALKHGKPVQASVTWICERGVSGRSQVSIVAKSGAPLAPQQLIRQAELRRYGHAVGRSLF